MDIRQEQKKRLASAVDDLANALHSIAECMKPEPQPEKPDMIDVPRLRIGKQIRAIRRKRKLTQAELGDLCDMAAARISDAENDKGRLLIETVGRIAAGLGVDLVCYLKG